MLVLQFLQRDIRRTQTPDVAPNSTCSGESHEKFFRDRKVIPCLFEEPNVFQSRKDGL